MHQHSKQASHDMLGHVNDQLTRIDQLIVDLLHDVDLDELKSKERIDLVIKLMTQQARVLILRQSCSNEQPAQKERMLADMLASTMRGERSDHEEKGDD